MIVNGIVTSLIICIFWMFSGVAMATEYIAKFKSASALKAATMQLDAMHATDVKAMHQAGALLKLSIHERTQVDELKRVAEISQRNDVEYIVPNIKLYALGAASNDPQISSQWALEKVNAARAWEVSKGSKNVIVAVIDTGVALNHEDLAANAYVNPKEVAGNGKDDDGNGFIDDVNGWDFRDNDANPNDETGAQNPGHGTHCAGIIGAVGNNGVGISGISQNVSIMALRFLGADGSGDLFASIKAIDYAIAAGAHIISASWGAAVPRTGAQPLIDAIGRADQKGIIFVAAAANDGKSNDTREVYPANAGLPNMISVAASDQNDAKPQWSNFGKHTVDLASPGLGIFSTLPGNKYGNLSGTSMATPLVAGMVALLKSIDPSLSGAQARSILQSSGAKVQIETACNCRIDAAAAVESVVQKKLVLVPHAATIAVGGKLQLGAYGGVGPFTFTSSAPDVAAVDANGQLSGQKEGEVRLTVKDANGNEAQSLAIYIGKKSSDGGGGGGGGGEEGQCPFPNPQLCEIMCQIMPTAPWCQG